MITAFIASMFLSFKNVISAFIPLFIIWIIQPFLESTIISHVIIYLLFTPATFLLGYYLKKKLIIYKVFYGLLLICIGFYGFNNFWYIITNKNSRETLSFPKVELYNSNYKIRLDTIEDKVIILDFWTTNCGVCFQKFPDFEKKYFKYKNSPKVELFAVNIPVRTDTLSQANNMINKYNYEFSKLYADSDTIPKLLGFNRYPHQIILKNGKIRFNGSLNINEKNIFVYKLEDEVKRLLDE